ncbi:hypothetical protein T03_13769 [Trichinella britovi]|uniref:Uncharacterized protein n=1 Tax=Trichinella britovi TaxID=45882 RepID=A0A0V1D9Z0_TRIBR|nr:hypothetical protein T03_13769 [Trichinella britovi]
MKEVKMALFRLTSKQQTCSVLLSFDCLISCCENVCSHQKSVVAANLVNVHFNTGKRCLPKAVN